MSQPIQRPLTAPVAVYSTPRTGQAAGYPPPPAEPIFQVRTVKHTGAMVIWINQRRTTTGTYAQCSAAIDAAQQHCLLVGWWSIASLLWNPISLSENASARRALRRQAQQAHEYAVWWATYYNGTSAHAGAA